MENKRKNKKPITFRKIMRRRLLSGLLVLVPLGLTMFVVQFLYDLTVGRVEPFVRVLFNPLPAFVTPIALVLLLVTLTYALGLLANIVLGRKLIGLFDYALENTPLIKVVYGASKQIVQVLSAEEDNRGFKSVLVVDFPMAGMKTFAFVSGKILLEDLHEGKMKEHYRVFIPTTPNPTSGYLQFVPVDEAEEAGISVEDAIRTIMSAGLVIPDTVGPCQRETPTPDIDI